ncbi:hypothetical protein TNCV_1882371 [Trichonephila clavipes]|nr:hypothetical protein TNCV_1882371 [Trichonephila clavipes]
MFTLVVKRKDDRRQKWDLKHIFGSPELLFTLKASDWNGFAFVSPNIKQQNICSSLVLAEIVTLAVSPWMFLLETEIAPTIIVDLAWIYLRYLATPQPYICSCNMHVRVSGPPKTPIPVGSYDVTPLTYRKLATNSLPRSEQITKITCVEVFSQRTIDKYSACVEVGKLIDENSACVEVGTTHKHLRRGDKSNNFKNYFSSNDITCEEVKSVDSQRFLHWIHRTCEQQGSQKKKETATHIGIREAEDWFRPIDLAKECDIYISSRSGSHKEIPITYGYTQTPLKINHKTLKQRLKRTIPNIMKEKIKIALYAVIHLIAQETSEKQNSDECTNLRYVNIFVENQPVTALIDSGCQIPVLNSSLIRVQTPSEEIITLSSCFGEQRMVEVKPINISLNQHSTSLNVRTAISPTLTEEFILHPSVYSEIEKLGHAKSDVLLSESKSSLSADLGVQFNSSVSFPNVSVSNVIENSSYDLPYVKDFNIRNDLSSLIKDYKCNKIKSTKLKLSIVREKCSDIVLCKKANGAMKTSSVKFISRSPTPSPMNSNYRRFVLLRRIFQPWQWKRRKREIVLNRRPELYRGKISMRSTKDQLVEKMFLCR